MNYTVDVAAGGDVVNGLFLRCCLCLLDVVVVLSSVLQNSTYCLVICCSIVPQLGEDNA